MRRQVTVTRSKPGRLRGGAWGWAALLVFALSLLLNSLTVTASLGLDSGHGQESASFIVEICADGHSAQVVMQDDTPAPSPPHDCADCCVLCFFALSPDAAGGCGEAALTDAAMPIVTLALRALSAWRIQSRPGNPRGPPALA